MFTDPGDKYRLALLTELFDRMQNIPGEEERIRGKALAQLELQKSRGLSGRSFQEIWERLLSLPLETMKQELLGPGPDAAELRHAHMFAGCLPDRELNRIRQEAKAATDDAAGR